MTRVRPQEHFYPGEDREDLSWSLPTGERTGAASRLAVPAWAPDRPWGAAGAVDPTAGWPRPLPTPGAGISSGARLGLMAVHRGARF